MASFVEAQSMLWVYASEKSKIMLTLYMDGPLLLIRYVYVMANVKSRLAEYNRWSTPQRKFSGDNSSFFNFFKLFQKKKRKKKL